MSDTAATSPFVRRVPTGLAQSATYVETNPGTFDVSTQTKLHRDATAWTLTGIDVTLAANGDTLQPMIRALTPDETHRLLVVADTVRVTDVLAVPGVAVTIHARVLEFADGAQINTQAVPYTEAEAPTEIGAPGKMGRFSGPVELYVGELSILGDSAQTLIKTDGTDGTMGGPGRPGIPGDDDVFGINFEAAEGDAIRAAVNTHRQWTLIRDKGLELTKDGAVISVTVSPNPDVIDDRTIQIPDPKPNLNGRATPDDKQPGAAGQGSLAAYVTALPPIAHQLAERDAVSMVPGRNADIRLTSGGAATLPYKPDDTDKKTPVKAYEISTLHDSKTKVMETILGPKDLPVPALTVIEVKPVDGPITKGAAAPDMGEEPLAIGADSRVCDWLHLMHADVYGSYLAELSRGGFTDQFHDMSTKLDHALKPIRATYARGLPDVDFDDEASLEAFQSAFDALPGDTWTKQADQDGFATLVRLQHQISTQRKQADKGIDHYSNPAGWAPNLSFAAEMDLTRGAGEAAVRALYVSQWLTAASDSVEAIIQAHWEAIVEVRKRRQADYERQSKLGDVMAEVATKSERLQLDIDAMKSRLKTVTDELEREAENRAIWAAAVDIVGSLMTVIPYGQPALGMAGKAVKASSTYINGSATGEEAFGKVLDQGKALGKKGLSKRSDKFKKQAEKLEEKATTAEGAKYWDKYKSEERKAFDEGQAAEAEESRAAAKVPKARAAQWSAVADNFTDAATDIYGDIKVLAAPEDAAKDLLKQLESADDAFKAFTAEIEDLNLRKAKVVGEILDAYLQMALIASDIAETHRLEGVFIDALTEASKGRMNPNVIGAADQMKAHALEWLTHQRYKLVKAYEALFLEPCPVPSGSDKFSIDWLVGQFEATVKTLQIHAETAADSRNIWQDSLEALQGYLEDFTTAIARAIIEKLEGAGGSSLLPPEDPTPIVLELSPEQLAILNEGQDIPKDKDGNDVVVAWPRTITIDVGANSYFPYGHDKAVIRSITVRDIKVSEREGADQAQKGYRNASFVVQHFGNGILKGHNALYAVRYGQTPLKTLQSGGADTGMPPAAAKWEFSYDEGTKETKSGGGLGDESAGLLQSLMGALTQDRSRIEVRNFLRSMPAWTQLMITAESNTARWARIDKLVLEVHLNAIEAENATSGLDLRMDDDSEWPVFVTHADGRQEKMTTPALILGEAGTDVTIRPDHIGTRMIATIDGKDPSGEQDEHSIWTLPLRRSTVMQLKMAEDRSNLVTPSALPTPTVAMGWQPGPLNLMEALRAGIITRHEPVWNPKHALAYAYSLVDGEGKETGLSPWTSIGPVEYWPTHLTLPVWPDDLEIADMRLYRRIRPDAHHGPWGEIHEIAAYSLRNGVSEPLMLDTPMQADVEHGVFQFYDATK